MQGRLHTLMSRNNKHQSNQTMTMQPQLWVDAQCIVYNFKMTYSVQRIL